MTISNCEFESSFVVKLVIKSSKKDVDNQVLCIHKDKAIKAKDLTNSLVIGDKVSVLQTPFDFTDDKGVHRVGITSLAIKD